MAKVEELQLMPNTARKSKLNLILIVLLVLMTGAAGYFGWRSFKSGSAKAAAAPAQEEAPAADAAESKGEEGHGGETGAAGHPGNESAILNFEPFLVNLADREAFRYLRVTIRLQVTNKAAAEKIASTEVLSSQIRDTILSTLATKVSEQIVTPEGKDQLKGEIAEKLNAFLPGKPVKAVFFTDFVVQL